MPDYDATQFSPPAPVVSVTLRNPENGTERANILMLLDTGADVTLLPQSIVGELGIGYSADSYEISDFEGRTSNAHAVRAEMIFLDLTFRGQFLLIEQDWGIIGRNILNAVSLTFDGPKQLWGKT